MNIVFWLIVAVLIALATLFVVWPLWRRAELEVSDADQRNILIARQRLSDLKKQKDEGVLTQAQFAEQYEELELTLNDDLDSFQLSRTPVSQGRWMIPVVFVTIPLLSLLLYFQLGDPGALYKAEQQQVAREKQRETEQNINKMVAGLAERMKQNPDDLEGWVMLGRSYKFKKNYPAAAAAFAQAYRLAGEDVGVMLQFADALAMQNGGSMMGAPSELVFKALEKSPDDVTGLWLGGMAKAEAGELDTALQLWMKLELLLPAQSESYQELVGLIAALKERIHEIAAAEDALINIRVSVNLSADYLKQAQSRHTLFVYAQALDGPKMPLAIVRKTVAELPLTVDLNDSMAMTPAMKLSSFNAVKVIARISASGAAMPQPGDLIGMVELHSLSANSEADIIINQEVR